MRVTVRYMARMKGAAGVPTEQVELPDPSLLGDLLARLAECHGEPLRQLLGPALLVFVDEEQATPGGQTLLTEGNVVTLLAPMAGG